MAQEGRGGAVLQTRRTALSDELPPLVRLVGAGEGLQPATCPLALGAPLPLQRRAPLRHRRRLLLRVPVGCKWNILNFAAA